MRFSTTSLLAVCWTTSIVKAFSPLPSFQNSGRTAGFVPSQSSFLISSRTTTTSTSIGISFIPIDGDGDGDESPLEPDDDDDDNEDDDEDINIDPYLEAASSEFVDDDDDDEDNESSSSALANINRNNNKINNNDTSITSDMDWGGAYGKLAERLDDSTAPSPSKALFRIMTTESPNQAIDNFLQSANPQVVGAMSGAVSSLLGGLSNPSKGMETIVKTTGDKIGNLCFQLQMTGYMFRNAEYVMALKELMNIQGGATLQDYRAAFDRLDSDDSGYVDSDEIEALLADVYDGDKVPGFEIESFLQFFDSNNDGKISWQEFERGLGNISQQEAAQVVAGYLPESRRDDDDDNDDDDDDDEDVPELKAKISGMIQIELDNGQMIEVEANEYMESLKKEAEELKAALRRELGAPQETAANGTMMPSTNSASPPRMTNDGIASYVASRKNDLQSLTESVQPEIMETMKLLVDFVLKGGNSRRNANKQPREMEMEIPGAALQQLALWQLVLGYKLREAEATGDYMKLMD